MYSEGKQKGKKRKMESADDKISVKLKTTHEKFENLTITVKNDKATKPSPKQPAPKASIDLLKQLKLLQAGKVSPLQLQKSKPAARTVKSAQRMEDEIQRNKEEVQRLNANIQRKIFQQIKPKLQEVLDRPDPPMMNGSTGARRKTFSEPSLPAQDELQQDKPYPISKLKPLRIPGREVPMTKSIVKLPSDEEIEIYRYSIDDMYQLETKATWQFVPRLHELKICATALTPLDSFLMKLLNAKDEDRNEIILRAAESRNFIQRIGSNEFKFNTIFMPSQEPPPDTFDRRDVDDDRRKKPSPEIARIKLNAKNDVELNELMYRHEFENLFEEELKEQDAKAKPLPDLVQYLLDTNQAYVLEGDVRVNSKNHQEAYVPQSKKRNDVCITKMILRKHAFHGDFVKVLVKQMEDTNEEASGDDMNDTLQSEPSLGMRHFGCVLEVLEKRHSRRVIGSLSTAKKDRKHITISIRDPKIPSVRIGREGIPKDTQLTDKTLLVVEVTSWSHDQPKGKIVSIIGEKGKLDTENAAILIQHNLDPQPFSQEIIDQVPTEPFTIPESEFVYREDLRKTCIFSIDPETARDLDDALSCTVLPNGNLEIGVHISDVSYFLKENSELDEIVKGKATTIYLVDKVYHMLPLPLCLLCSLLPGADKMAYSVFWEIDGETSEIFKTRFTRSVLNSCAKLSYDHAQMVIDSEDQDWSKLENEFPEIHNGFTVGDVAEVILKLQKLAVIMRDKRKANGALKIDQPKIAFKFDKDDQRMEAPVDFFKYCIKDSNRLIEEFMLLANISVAKFIYEKFPEISLLRQHDPPNEGGMKKLVKTLQKQGVVLDTSSSAALSASMENVIASAKEKSGMNAVLNLLVSKTMSRARYFCSSSALDEKDFWHYALSIPIYTHFTSPIRRYADVLVHR